MELKITDLKKTYGNVKALKGINYTFTPGVYGILGANGAGKSTMINLITDNVSRDKNGGSIMYSDGEDNTVSKELVDILKLGAKFRGVVGYMPQQQGFYEEFSPKAFLKYMAEIKGIKKINRKKILILIPIMYFLIIGCLTYAGEWLLGKMGSPFSTELYLVIFYALMIVLLSAGMIGILCMLGTPIKSKKIEGQLIDIGFTDKEGNAPILLSKEKDKKGV